MADAGFWAFLNCCGRWFSVVGCRFVVVVVVDVVVVVAAGCSLQVSTPPPPKLGNDTLACHSVTACPLHSETLEAGTGKGEGEREKPCNELRAALWFHDHWRGWAVEFVRFIARICFNNFGSLDHPMSSEMALQCCLEAIIRYVVLLPNAQHFE